MKKVENIVTAIMIIFVAIVENIVIAIMIIFALAFLCEFMVENEEVKNNKKYSIPIYENGVKTEWTIDGVIGDDKYFELLKYGNGKDLPDIVNVGVEN